MDTNTIKRETAEQYFYAASAILAKGMDILDSIKNVESPEVKRLEDNLVQILPLKGWFVIGASCVHVQIGAGSRSGETHTYYRMPDDYVSELQDRNSRLITERTE